MTLSQLVGGKLTTVRHGYQLELWPICIINIAFEKSFDYPIVISTKYKDIWKFDSQKMATTTKFYRRTAREFKLQDIFSTSYFFFKIKVLVQVTNGSSK